MADNTSDIKENFTVGRVGAVHGDRDGGNHTVEVYDTDEDVISVVVPVVFVIIFIVGIVGNSCVIGAVLRYKSMRSAPNYFILNLAVGDVLLLLISVPTSGLLYTVNSWPFGLAVCKLSYFVKTLSLGVTIFTLTALSVDRVMVIAQTLKTISEKPSRRITIMVVIVWVLSIAIAIPDAISYHLNVVYYSDGENTTYCSPHPKHWKLWKYDKIHATVHIVIFFFIPLTIIAVSYGTMAYFMVNSAKLLPGESVKSSVWRIKQIKMRRRVANIVIVFIVLFFICWLPRNIFLMVVFYSKGVQQMTPALYIFRMVTYCLSFSNSCVNPIALYFLSKSFKTHYMKQLCCGRKLVRTSETDLATRESQKGENVLTKLTSANENNNHLNGNTEVDDCSQSML